MKLPFTGSADYDLVIVGLGSAGILAAEVAAGQLGLRVAAVERERVGGDCLWTGCIPSKALIASARAAQAIRHADRFAIGAQEPTIDLARVWHRIHAIQAEIAATDDNPDRIRDLGVDLLDGDAVVTGAREVTVGDRVLTTRYILVCTGSRPFIPPIDGIADIDVLTSENIFASTRPPDSLIVVGGGPMGCEFAQALQRLNVAITLLEAGPRLLPDADEQHAARLLRILRDEGIDVRLDADARKARRGGDGINVWFDASSGSRSAGGKVTAQGLLVAAGRTANAYTLGLDRLGIELGAHGIVVDDHNRTTVETIYAVGDVTGGNRYTHVAGHDAVMAVRDMFFPGRGTPPETIPRCTFTDPEVARVGLTEAEAIERFGRRKVEVHRADLEDSDRARTDDATDGEIAIVTASGRIVGAHAICRHAGELIHELALATKQNLKLSELAESVHVYPTLSSTIGLAAADAAYRTARRLRPLAKAGRLHP